MSHTSTEFIRGRTRLICPAVGRPLTLAMSALFVAGVVLTSIGCAGKAYDPTRATRAYPRDLHTTNVVNMQVFRREDKLQIVNTTARSYADFDLWLNQRYVKRIDSLPAGETVRVSLYEFFDERGDQFRGGGFFRTVEAMPVRLVQIQPTPESPMIGLITIREDDAQRRGL